MFSEKPGKDAIIPINKTNSLISGKSFHYINSKIFESTVEAHSNGGVPCMILKFEEFNEFELGKIIFFFEKSCILSALLLGLNPFNQPGVENYKHLTKKYLRTYL
ncbi:MAG: hypothetical protein LBJ32_04735 [Oscillospiraceae bacterium]|nr:hypothetical protein [Oscillospiraceae bacterium]